MHKIYQVILDQRQLGRQEIHAELLEIQEGAWFPAFDPTRHVSDSAEYQAGLPVRLAVDCGVSGHTGAVFFQVRRSGHTDNE